MAPETPYLLALAVGLGATLFMDLWALFLNRAFRAPSPNYCLVGRWVCHMPAGTFTHPSIAAASRKNSECAVGWITHYAVGAAYALLFVVLASGWLARPTLWPALLFGVATVMVPFLVMQPSFGLGIASSRAPNPTQARLRSLMAHTAFGLGVYVCAVALSFVQRGQA
jgi:cytochrome b561